MTHAFAERLAARGITIDGAAKMPIKTAKSEVTLAQATAKVLENLEANKAYWLGNSSELEVKQRNYKVVGDVYSIGLKYTIRYLKNVFKDGDTVAKFKDKDEFIAMYDILIEGIKGGDFSEQVRMGIAANASMRRTKH